MKQIKVDETKPKYRIDYDYETWRTDKEYWINKFEEIKHSFDWKYPTQEALLKIQYELHRWQMYVNIAFNIKDTEAIKVSFDYDTNTLHINLNNELVEIFC